MKNRALFNWLENEWRISNAPKYQHYFKEWVEKLTDAQIEYFDKMRNRKIYMKNKTKKEVKKLDITFEQQSDIKSVCDHDIKQLRKPEDGWTHSCSKCGKTWSL